MPRYDAKVLKTAIDSYMAEYAPSYKKMIGGNDSGIVSYYDPKEKTYWLRGFEIDLQTGEIIITCAKKLENRMTADDVDRSILEEINTGGDVFVTNIIEIEDEILLNYTTNIARQLENLHYGITGQSFTMGNLSPESKRKKAIDDFMGNLGVYALKGIRLFVQRYNTIEGRL